MRSAILFMVMLGAFSANALTAHAEHVVDRAKFFSADAVKQAEDAIAELGRKHSVPVRVETFETVPDDQAEKVKGMSAKERGGFFANWLKKLAQEKNAKGVFVLICREPSHLRIGVSKELHNRGFTDADRDAATGKLISAFKEKEYDRGLQSALASIQTSADRRLKAAAAQPDKAHDAPPVAPDSGIGLTGWLCLGIAGLIAIMAVIGLAGMLFRGGSGAPAPGAPAYGGGGFGGGGLMGGLLSGLGGALLGNWIYDQWSGGRAHAGEHDSGTGHTGGGGDDNYQDFNSSGGDFGDSGGGDFGGGDFGGGGDSGGGDF